jgi:hypothetical protein
MKEAHEQSQFNPVISVSTGIGILGSLAAAGVGALGARALLERGTGGVVTKSSLARELSAAILTDATIGDMIEKGHPQGVAQLPIAMNTYGLVDVEGPTEDTMPYVTQPDSPLDMIGRDGTRIPLDYLYAGRDGEVGLRVDQDTMLERGVAYPVTDEATWADGTLSGARTQVGKLVTDLAPSLATVAYEEALRRIHTDGESYSVPSGTRDEFVASVLKNVVPSHDWSQGLEGLSGQTAALWRGVSLVGQIAYQDYWVSRG